MILKASQRTGARSFANHLLNKTENDHVEVHEIRGLVAEKLHGALLEIDAISKGTKAKQPFFAVTFNPPDDAHVTLDEFEAAFADVEQKLGLVDQPRAVVFHEKEGRRHAHVVWSRIVHHIDQEKGTDTLKAINMNHFKSKLQDLSRELYLQHGWEMPKGLKNKQDRDPLNFDLQTWQQAKRLKEDPRDLKKIIQEALHTADSAKAVGKALEMQGLYLASGVRGKKANFVVVHHSGEVMSLTRYSGMKSKELIARLGDPVHFPDVGKIQNKIKALKTAALKEQITKLKAAQKKALEPLKAQLKDMRVRQRQERAALKEKQEQRWVKEVLVRSNRLRKGIRGLWDRLTGTRGKVSRQNAQEAEAALRRDRNEKQKLIDKHLAERRKLQEKIAPLKSRHSHETAEARFGIGLEMKKQKGKLQREWDIKTQKGKAKEDWTKEKPITEKPKSKLRKDWEKKDQPREKDRLSDRFKEAAGSGSGGGKAPPRTDSDKEQAEKSKTKEPPKQKKKDVEKDQGEGRERSRPRPRGPRGPRF